VRRARTRYQGRAFHPGQRYYVGGRTKFYGAILFRLRERDFGEIHHHGGISPAWPLSYQDSAPYYDEAERLYPVHGERGEDPTEPPTSGPYPYPAVSHEPRIETRQRMHADDPPEGHVASTYRRAETGSGSVRCQGARVVPDTTRGP
jgi:choline dehydrogenase-like flavoprotein